MAHKGTYGKTMKAPAKPGKKKGKKANTMRGTDSAYKTVTAKKKKK